MSTPTEGDQPIPKLPQELFDEINSDLQYLIGAYNTREVRTICTAIMDRSRLLAALATEGRVPREPTEAMMEVAYDLIPIAPGTETWAIGRWPHPDKLWQAMYDAAIRGDEGRGR